MAAAVTPEERRETPLRGNDEEDSSEDGLKVEKTPTWH